MSLLDKNKVRHGTAGHTIMHDKAIHISCLSLHDLSAMRASMCAESAEYISYEEDNRAIVDRQPLARIVGLAEEATELRGQTLVHETRTVILISFTSSLEATRIIR
jgi:hypothetical protein